MSTFELTMLGTGSPLPSPDRCGGGQAITAGGHTILIDCGWGVARRIQQARIPTASIEAVFFTHLHSDHITVYGPAGTRETVAGFQQALKADVGYRLAHHGEKLWSGGVACDVHEVEATDEARVIAKIGDIEVSAFLVDHRPVVPAFGFKVARNGHSIVFTGDTVRCPSLERAAKGADVLVSEVFNYNLMDRRITLLKATSNDLAAGLLGDAKSYHIPPKDVAEVAAQAGVKQLILTHFIPPVATGAEEMQEFVAGMSDIFHGTISIASDLEKFEID
jgi:ribonuclease Z